MKELEIFSNEEFGEVRVVEIENDPWFVAKDICDVLGLTNPTESLRGLDEDEVSNLSNSEVRGIPNRGLRIINESGLYSLILRSQKAEAKKFKKWVTSEVLPTIRKTGGYLSEGFDWTDLDNIQRVLDVAKEERAKRILAEKQIAKDKPKVEFYDAVTGSSDTIDMKEVAKILNIIGLGRNKLFEVLRGGMILDNNNQPYQRFVDAGLFRLVESKYYVDGEARINTKTVVYQKGLAYIRKFLENNGYINKEK